VRCWFSNKGRGVLAARPGALDGVREYYFDRRFLVDPGPIEEGNSVFFLPRPPMAGGRNPVAAMVVVEGAMIKASVDHVDPRGFGLSELRDGSDARQLLLIDFERLESTVTVGERILVKIRAGDHGPIGIAQ